MARWAAAEARLQGDWIVIGGKGNTLESVARDLGEPEILSFDPETGWAASARSMRVTGDLTIGGPATSGTTFRFANTLEFDVAKCGQAQIVLALDGDSEGPRLVIENSRIGAVRTEAGNDACRLEGNIVGVAAGHLALRGSAISGNFVVRATGGDIEIADSLVSTSSHMGISLAGASLSHTQIARLRSLDHKIYGMEIGSLGRLSDMSDGPDRSDSAVTLEQCTLRGGGADLHVRGRTTVIALDCDLDSMRFAGQGGAVRRQWTVAVRTPSPGCRVVAESEKGTALPERVEARADESGVARLALTEYVARAGGDVYLRAGRNDATPHRLTVYSADGNKIIGQLANYRVLARGQEVRIP